MNYKVGIIGCGNIFPMHGYPVNALEGCTLAAVCDVKEDRARAKAGELGCKYYLDYQEMIDREQLDVVHICTPHYLHPPMAIYALEHGCHVLTEKPMSTTFADTQAMVETAERTGKTLGVIFQNRYNPGSQLAKRTLESGELGKVLGARLRVTWMRTDEYYSKSDWKGTWDKEGGGVMIDQAIHTLDLLRWLVDSPVASVSCSIANRTHQLIDVEDEATGVVTFESGVLCAFHTVNYYTKDSEVELELHCEEGSVNIDSDRCTVRLNNGRTYTAGPVPGEAFFYGDVKGYWGVSHIKQINNFYQSLSEGKRPFVDGRDAMETMRMVLGLYDSGKSGQLVAFSRGSV